VSLGVPGSRVADLVLAKLGLAAGGAPVLLEFDGCELDPTEALSNTVRDREVVVAIVQRAQVEPIIALAHTLNTYPSALPGIRTAP
jgi:hypothetical protein